MAAQNDLLIIASAQMDFFEVLRRVPGTTSVEVRLDRRRQQRRQTPESATRDERRRRDRRMRDVSDQLSRVGWAFVPGSERGL